MIHYKINSTYITVNNQRLKTYGIDIYDDNAFLQSIFDISPDKSLIQELIYKCNVYDAAPEHIMDIVYDYIN